MEERNLNIEARTKFGSSQSKRFRREGKVPVTIAMSDASSLSGLVTENEFVHLAQASHYTDVIVLKSADKNFNDRKVLVKDLQQEPLKGKILHVDFQALEEGKEVKVKVPVKLHGLPEGVKTQGGILTQTSNNIMISCLPKNIPSHVDVDVSSLMVGQSVLAGEIKLADGLKLRSNARETIGGVVSSRTTRLQEASGEGETGEEGESSEEQAAEAGAEGKEASPQDSAKDSAKSDKKE